MINDINEKVKMKNDIASITLSQADMIIKNRNIMSKIE